MYIDVKAKMSCSVDMEPDDAFIILCKTLHMDFVLDEDRKFLVKKNLDGENLVYILENKQEKEYDDRGDLFIALRNVAVNMFPNATFRNEDYIYNQ